MQKVDTVKGSASEPMISVHYFQQIEETLRELGVSNKQWSKLAGVDLLTPASGPPDALSLTEYKRLINAAIELSQTPHIGLLVGQKLQVVTHGVLSFALMHCESLAQLVALLNRYIGLRSPLIEVEVEERKKEWMLYVNELYDLGDIRHSFLQTTLVALVNMVRYIAPDVRAVTSVCFPFTLPSDKNEYTAIFQTHLEDAQPRAGITLNKAYLNLPLHSGDASSFDMALKLCDEALSAMKRGELVSTQVRHLIISQQVFTLEEVAAHLCLSPRTLHRRLVAEQTSFRDILTDVRRTLSRQCLQELGFSVKRTAFYLGYADVANFRRAFKQWWGKAPSHYTKSKSL